MTEYTTVNTNTHHGKCGIVSVEETQWLLLEDAVGTICESSMLGIHTSVIGKTSRMCWWIFHNSYGGSKNYW